MNNMSRKKNWRRDAIEKVFRDNPEGRLVVNKYRVLRAILRRRYPELQALDQTRLLDVIFDAVNGNRDWQMMTEGYDTEQKKIHDQQWRMEQGYHDLPPTVANTPTRRDARDVR